MTTSPETAVGLVQDMSSPQTRKVSSQLAQVSVQDLQPEVVGDLVAAFRLELATLLPVFLAPLLEELKELKKRSAFEKDRGHDKICTASSSPDLAVRKSQGHDTLCTTPASPELAARSSSRCSTSSLQPSGVATAVEERPSASPSHLQRASAFSDLQEARAAGLRAAAAAEEMCTADKDPSVPNGGDKGACEDALKGYQQTKLKLAAATLDSLPMRMEVEMSTPMSAPLVAHGGTPEDKGKYEPLTAGDDVTDDEEARRASMKEASEKIKMARDGMQAGKPQQSWIAKSVTVFLEDSDSSSAALYYNHFMIVFSIFSIAVALLPYVGFTDPLSFEIGIDSIFCLEIITRAVFCPTLTAFVADPANLIDALPAGSLTVIILMYGGVCEEDWGNEILLFATPFIRFLRFVRRFPKMQILITAFMDCLEALPVLLYTLCMMGCLFTSGIYLVEPRDNVATLSESAWLVISTISTVGYGDIYPCTKFGAALASVLMVVSQLYMAMPLGMIGYNFTIIWEHRDQILLLNRTRDRLAQRGIGAYEIPRLFELFDIDDSGEFDMEEFMLLFEELEIGFKEDHMVDLFKLIDKDASGTVDDKEFVKLVYPEDYRKLYTKSKKPEGVEDLVDDLLG